METPSTSDLPATNKVRDPVCGMMVQEGPQAITSDYKGNKFYFCSRGCKVAFDKAPSRYVNDDGTLKPGAQMPMGHP